MSNPDPTQPTDWTRVQMRPPTPESARRFSPGRNAGGWCVLMAIVGGLCAVGLVDRALLRPTTAVLVGAFAVWLLAHAAGWLAWMIGGRQPNGGRVAYAVVATLAAVLVFLLPLFMPRDQTPETPVLPAPAPPPAWVAAWTDALDVHANAMPAAPGDDIEAVAESRLAAFDRVATSANDAERARFASIRRLLRAHLDSDLRVAMATDAAMAAFEGGYAQARDPAALRRHDAAVAALELATKRNSADELALTALVEKEAQSVPKAERHEFDKAVRRALLAKAKTTARLTATMALIRARQAAYRVLARHPGAWRLENGRVRFSDGLVAAELSEPERHIREARETLEDLGVVLGELEEPSGADG